MKKKLFAAALSLAMASILMVSSSFAWFTVSTAPEVTDIDVTMTATKNLEIAAADKITGATAVTEVAASQAGDETKWGSKVTKFADAALEFPATIDSNTLKTINYDATGRTTALQEVSTTTDPVIAATSGATTSITPGYYTHTIKWNGTDTSKKVAAVYPLWLRSNVAGNITATVTFPENADANVKVAVKIGSSVYTATPTSNVATITGTDLKLTADTAARVDVIAYVDGASVKAADVDTAISVSGIKVAFSSSGIS